MARANAAFNRGALGERFADRRNPAFGIAGGDEGDRLGAVRAQHFVQHGKIGDDHRQPRHGGLDGGKPERFPGRGKHEQIGGGVEIGDVVLGHGTEHVQPVVNAERDRERVESFVLGAGAGKHEMRLRQAGQRADEHVLVFLRARAGRH